MGKRKHHSPTTHGQSWGCSRLYCPLCIAWRKANCNCGVGTEARDHGLACAAVPTRNPLRSIRLVEIGYNIETGEEYEPRTWYRS